MSVIVLSPNDFNKSKPNDELEVAVDVNGFPVVEQF